jgi:hypothetical protein
VFARAASHPRDSDWTRRRVYAGRGEAFDERPVFFGYLVPACARRPSVRREKRDATVLNGKVSHYVAIISVIAAAPILNPARGSPPLYALRPLCRQLQRGGTENACDI